MVAPIIELNGRPISGRPMKGAARAVADSIRIDWGRETLFDCPRPGVATVNIVNYGLTADPPRKGESLFIRHPDYGVLFRGTVAEARTVATKKVRHSNGLLEDVTITKVTAHDAMASFAQFLPVGPISGEHSTLRYTGEGGWADQEVDRRIGAVMSAGARRFIDLYSLPSAVVSQVPHITAFAGARRAADDSALTLLHAAYSMYGPLHTFTYAANSHRLYTAPVQPASESVVTLTQGANGALSVTTPSNVYTIPARLVELDATEASAPADDVASVRTEYIRWARDPGTQRFGHTLSTANRDVPNASGATTYTAPEAPYFPADNPPSDSARRYLDWWVGRAVSVFSAINGVLRLPALIIDPEDARLAGTGQTFHTYQRGRSFYLNGSKFNSVPGAPAVVQIIGGTLTYTHKKGWRHALTPASTAGGAPEGLTLDQLFPRTSTDRLDRWADDLTINDLAAANRRA